MAFVYYVAAWHFQEWRIPGAFPVGGGGSDVTLGITGWMKSAALKYAALWMVNGGGWGGGCLAVVSIMFLPWQSMTGSIKHFDHSQETPAVGWRTHRYRRCLPNGDAVFFGSLFFFLFFFYQSLHKISIANFPIWMSSNLKVKNKRSNNQQFKMFEAQATTVLPAVKLAYFLLHTLIQIHCRAVWSGLCEI